MKLFKRFRNDKTTPEPQPVPAQTEENIDTAAKAPDQDEPEEAAPSPAADKAADDGFVEWRRSRPRGGIERRERNDIYEAYNVYGADSEGRLTVRCYHRYPEHERDFGLSYSRALSFEEFNRRLLGELDSDGLKLSDYYACIRNAVQLADSAAESAAEYSGFDEEEEAALRAFCNAADTLQQQSYLHSEGVLRCECESVVGGERLNIWFRRPLPHDAADMPIAGVSKEEKAGYDIDNLWIMSVYNRLREKCRACSVTLLTSLWSVDKESLYLFAVNGFEGIEGSLLIAVGEADSFRRFGFYSLDFSKK